LTPRVQALILGVRESATADRIKEAHRRILRINHPDMGGSTCVHVSFVARIGSL